jgi:hypothetical protein
MVTEHSGHAGTTTSGTPRIDISQCAGAFAYEHSDIPPDMTISAWRAKRHRLARRHRKWPRANTNRGR